MLGILRLSRRYSSSSHSIIRAVAFDVSALSRNPVCEAAEVEATLALLASRGEVTSETSSLEDEVTKNAEKSLHHLRCKTLL